MSWAAAIPAALDFVGGMLDRDSASDQADQNTQMQKEFAQNGIRWKVADAQAAGVHPLFALGGNTATYSPNPITTNFGQTLSNMGQNLTRAMAAQQTAEERALHQAQLDHLAAQTQKEFAQASYYNSEAARNAQPAAAPMPPSLPPVVADLVQGKPMEVLSSRSNDPSATAGNHPTWQTYDWAPGVKVDVPYSSEGMSESLENPMTVLGSIGRNIREYGPWWLHDVLAHKRARVEMPTTQIHKPLIKDVYEKTAGSRFSRRVFSRNGRKLY